MTDRRTFVAGALLAGAAAPVMTARAAANLLNPARNPIMQRTGVVELRQYTLFGGKRDVLATLFEREFVEPQEAVGAQVLGTCRDLDDPDRFVWFRGFENMETLGRALPAFYGGEIWKAHREAANTTMVDSDNVLLLRPRPEFRERPDFTLRGDQLLLASIHYLGPTPSEAFVDFFKNAMLPPLIASGAAPISILETESSANNFPALPVREGEKVLVWLGRFPDRAALHRFEHAWTGQSGWRDAAPASVLPALMRKPERLRLARA